MPMTEARIRAINRDRLSSWERKLTQSHATPALLLGIGHDHVSGQVHVCVCEGVSTESIRAFLRMALQELAKSERPAAHGR